MCVGSPPPLAPRGPSATVPLGRGPRHTPRSAAPTCGRGLVPTGTCTAPHGDIQEVLALEELNVLPQLRQEDVLLRVRQPDFLLLRRDCGHHNGNGLSGWGPCVDRTTGGGPLPQDPGGGGAGGGGAGMHWKGRDLRGGPRGGQAGGWRRLPKRLGAVTVGYKCH